MNYYERYCGDYGRDTAHLSLMEHGAYTLMLDVYYATEKPLPASLDALYRICRAMSKDEQRAVKSVAEQFFPVGSDGVRRNARAERDIIKASARIKAARINGMRRCADRLDVTEDEPSGLPSGLPNGSANESPPDCPPGTYGESTTRHSPSKPNVKTKAREPAVPVALPDWMPPEWMDFDEMRRAKNGKAWTRRAQEMAIRELGKLRAAGHDPTAVLCQSIIAGYPGLYPPKVASIGGRSMSPSELKSKTIDDIISQGNSNGISIDGVAERVDRPAVSAFALDLRQQGGHDVRGSGQAGHDGDLGGTVGKV